MRYSDRPGRSLTPMGSDTTIISIEKDGPDGIIVTFSDGTVGAYVAEELLELRPYRERVRLESIPGAKEKGISLVARAPGQVLHSRRK